MNDRTRARSNRERIVEEIRSKYWASLEGKHKPGAWEALDSAYSASSRAYHSWTHIADLLKKLADFSRLAVREDLVAIAVFWHDAVYVTRDPVGRPRPDLANVSDSADLFRRYTLLNKSDAAAVCEMIMATADHMHARAETEHYVGFSDDLDLFLDLDLSPLGSPWRQFVENFADIRFEYSFVPEPVFWSAHIPILENFARGSRLYRRAESRAEWAEAAESNIARCLAELKARIGEDRSRGPGELGPGR